jgi:hypothetical protein
MNQFVESLYRLYGADKIDKAHLDKLLANKKINKQEYDYIISAKKVA